MQSYNGLVYPTVEDFVKNSSKAEIADRVLKNYEMANKFNHATLNVIEEDPAKAYIHGSSFSSFYYSENGQHTEHHTGVSGDKAKDYKETDIHIINARIKKMMEIKKMLDSRILKHLVTKGKLKEKLEESNSYFNSMLVDLQDHLNDISECVIIE